MLGIGEAEARDSGVKPGLQDSGNFTVATGLICSKARQHPPHLINNDRNTATPLVTRTIKAAIKLGDGVHTAKKQVLLLPQPVVFIACKQWLQCLDLETGLNA